VIDYSQGDIQLKIPSQTSVSSSNLSVQYVTEGKILKHTVEAIDQTKAGDTIWLGMFYLTNRGITDALHQASARDVTVNIILDPNKVAFSSQKIGLHNAPIAQELKEDKGKDIRWYKTKDMKCHPIMMYIEKENEHVIIGGSANFTTRNL